VIDIGGTNNPQFAVYSAVYLKTSGHPFDPATAFTSLSIITLLSQSVQWWVIALVTFQASLGCYERVQSYLLSKTREDVRLSRSSSSEADIDKPKPAVTVTNVSKSENDVELNPFDGFALAVENGSFTFSDQGPPVLRDIQLRIQDSTLTMLIGPVGSGKSVLLRALLGETPPSSGVVYVSHRSMAYCGQEPWLPNVAIRQAILGISDFEHLWYSTVVHACALDTDIQQFPRGDASLIGSKGISLSEGQKQRLAVARAIYARKRILLLDDVLSGLDGKTEQMVFHRVFGAEGLCRKFGVTVLLATHAIKYLQHADLIITLDNNGRIAEQKAPKQPDFQLSGVLEVVSHEETAADSNVTPGSNDSSHAQPPVRSKTRNEQTSKLRQDGDLRVYVFYARVVGWILAVYLCLQASTTFFIKFPDVWLRWWSAAEASDPGKHTRFYLGIYCMFAGLAICSMVIGLLTLATGVMPRSSLRLHKRLLDAVMTARYSFLSVTDSGIILNRWVSVINFESG
jgi:ATP-binding cassette, subfamily C (CFTR/MRP), member 1